MAKRKLESTVLPGSPAKRLLRVLSDSDDDEDQLVETRDKPKNELMKINGILDDLIEAAGNNLRIPESAIGRIPEYAIGDALILGLATSLQAKLDELYDPEDMSCLDAWNLRGLQQFERKHLFAEACPMAPLGASESSDDESYSTSLATVTECSILRFPRCKSGKHCQCF